MSYSTDPLFFSLKPGDRIRSVGFPAITSFVYHVRGRVDDALIVRQWNARRGWQYSILTREWLAAFKDSVKVTSQNGKSYYDAWKPNDGTLS